MLPRSQKWRWGWDGSTARISAPATGCYALTAGGRHMRGAEVIRLVLPNTNVTGTAVCVSHAYAWWERKRKGRRGRGWRSGGGVGKAEWCWLGQACVVLVKVQFMRVLKAWRSCIEGYIMLVYCNGEVET